MRLIKNFDALNKTPQRKICLELIESALASIQPQNVIQKNISLQNDILKIQDKTFNLKDFERIFLLGFGKGSGGISKEIEKILGNFLTEGYVIDLEKVEFAKIEFSLGTHPLPSQENLDFTRKTIEQLNNLTMKDLVLVVVAGGGSALLVHPYKISLEKLIEVNKSLLLSGANISEMNIVRKHLSLVKGGGLAKLLHPSKVVSIIASDVPGNDLSVIASGPTVKDPTAKEEALEVLKKYDLLDKLSLSENDFLETPKEDKYFENVINILLLSNMTALNAMVQKAKELGFETEIFSDKFQSEAKTAGQILINKASPNKILLAGGETTVKVIDKNSKGGRNQELVLGALGNLTIEQFNKITIASFDSDGWDNSHFAGAIVDKLTIEKAKKLNLNLDEYLETNNTLPFFEKIGDGIDTGRLPSNVSDLIIVIKVK